MWRHSECSFVSRKHNAMFTLNASEQPPTLHHLIKIFPAIYGIQSLRLITGLATARRHWVVPWAILIHSTKRKVHLNLRNSSMYNQVFQQNPPPPSRFTTKFVYVSVSPMCATSPANLIILNSISLIIHVNSNIYEIFPHLPVASSLRSKHAQRSVPLPVRYEDLTARTLNIAIFCNMTPYCLVNRFWRFRANGDVFQKALAFIPHLCSAFWMREQVFGPHT